MDTQVEKSVGLSSFDVADVVRAKLPQKSRYIPGFAIEWLRRLICQRQLNEILAVCRDKYDVDFVEGTMNYIGAEVRIKGEENLPAADCGGRYVFVSNHPMGGLDGLAIISLLGRRYGGDMRFMVNDLLMAVQPCKGLFLPVNKFGRQSRRAAEVIDNAFRSPLPIATFPAGLCSRMDGKGEISDRRWMKSFVSKAIEHGRDVVPMYFEGRNSSLFYRLARWRERLGIKFNIEMLLLPREMIGCRGKTFTLHIGKPITCAELTELPAAQMAEKIKRHVYSLWR